MTDSPKPQSAAHTLARVPPLQPAETELSDEALEKVTGGSPDHMTAEQAPKAVHAADKGAAHSLAGLKAGATAGAAESKMQHR